jgi:dihydropteroate synthase
MNKSININGSLIDLSSPLVMGILNVTPDSFFKNSRKQSEKDIINRCRQIMDEGGSIIDLGAQSTTSTSKLLTAV